MLGRMGLFSRRRGDDLPVDPDARSPQLGVKYKDLMLLDQLMKLGSDLTQPRHVIHFSYAPSAVAQGAMVAEAQARGFEVAAGEPLPEYPDDWPVRCEHTVALHPELVRDNTDFFEELASRHGGVYDGWEAAAG
jgi:regulator of RNase E activity RraB